MRSALAVLVILGCAAAMPQPREIVLRDGAGSAEGQLRGRQHRRYSLQLTAKAVTIDVIVEPMRSAVVELYDPEGGRVLLDKEAAGRWTAPVPKPGHYSLVFARAVPSAPVSYYRLRITAH